MNRSGIQRGLIFIVILIGAIALFSLLFPSKKPAEIPLSEAVAMSQENKIQKIVVEGDALLITATDGSELKTFKETNASIYDIEGLNLEGVVVEIQGSAGLNWGGWLINLLPLLIPGVLLLLIFGGLLFFLLHRSGRFKR